MKPVQFKGQRYMDFYRELSQQVNGILNREKSGHYANGYFWTKLIFYYSGFLLTWFFFLKTDHIALYFLFYLINGLFVLGIIFNVAHDAAHHTIFRNRKWNDVLYYLSFPLLGNNPYVWKKFHIQSHHLYTNVEESDIDVINVNAIRLNESQPKKSIHRFQHLYAPVLYLFYSLNFILIRDMLKIIGKSQRTIDVQLNAKQLVGYVVSKLVFFSLFLIIPVFFSSVSTATIIAAFFLSQFLNSLVIILVLSCNHQVDLTDHLHHDETEAEPISWVELQLKANLDYSVRSRFFNFIVGGFNAHTVHHLLPQINHGHYLKIIPVMQDVANKYQVGYHPVSHGEALRSHFRFLYKMGH